MKTRDFRRQKGRDHGAPPGVVESLIRYEFDQIPTGGFLRAVLENNFVDAALRADHLNSQSLREIASFVRWELPAGIWGSKEAVASHLKRERVS